MTNVWQQKASKGGDGAGFAKAPPGNHPARLVAIVDMGTQWSDGFQGAAGKWRRTAYFVWELVTKPVEGQPGRNTLIACDLTLSLVEKAKLRKWVEARTGRAIPDGGAFDISSELGQPCLLNVVMKGEYPKIDNVSGVPDGMTVAAAKTTPLLFQLDPAHPEQIDVLPDWLPWFYGAPVGDKIKESKELAGDTHKPAAGPPAVPPTPDISPNPGTGTGGLRPPPRQPVPATKPEPADDSQWSVHTGGGPADWHQMSGAEVRALLALRCAEPGFLDRVHLTPEGADEDARSWRDHGFRDQIPF